MARAKGRMGGKFEVVSRELFAGTTSCSQLQPVQSAWHLYPLFLDALSLPKRRWGRLISTSCSGS